MLCGKSQEEMCMCTAYVQCQKERFSVGNLVTSVGSSKFFFPCNFKVSSVFLEVSEKDF